MKIEGLTFLILGVMSTQLTATVIFNSGGTHVVNSFIYDNIVLENFSDLDIVGGGLVITPGSDYAVHATSRGSGSSVNMSGDATVVGSIRMNDTDDISSSVIMVDDSTVYSSGGGSAAISGVHYVEINDNACIVGATSGGYGGNAIENGDSGHYHVTVNGGEVVGGHGGSTGGYGISSDIEVMHLEVTGGIVRGGSGDLNGGVGVVNMYSGSVLMTDGAVYGGDGGVRGGDAFYSIEAPDMSIFGGQVRGGNGSAYGGSGIVASSIDNANIQIFGGEFDAGLGSIADGWIFDVSGSGSSMSIFGGQIGYNAAGAGINIRPYGLVDIYGWDLTLNDGLLTGYLLDGNWIETAVTVSSMTPPDRGLRLFNHENVNLPEPSVLLLMMSGLAGVGLSRFRNH